MGSCTLAGLRHVSPSSTKSLLHQLRQTGFAVVSVEKPVQMILQGAIQQAQQLDTFRFPDINHIQYNEPKRAAFRGLFDIAVTTLKAILLTTATTTSTTTSTDTYPSSTNDVQKLLEAIEQRPTLQELFPDNNPHEPFAKRHTFSSSFFNLFNYDNGLLNPHVDRSLVTVLYSYKPNDTSYSEDHDEHPGCSTLWIQDRNGHWRDGDRASSGANQVLVMVGDELPQLDDDTIRPAKHAVKVDPCGDVLPHSHFCRDPQSPPRQNRKSVAFILRHEASLVP